MPIKKCVLIFSERKIFKSKTEGKCLPGSIVFIDEENIEYRISISLTFSFQFQFPKKASKANVLQILFADETRRNEGADRYKAAEVEPRSRLAFLP